MIPVKQAAEPTYFDKKVRRPGLAFINNYPDEEPKALWTRAHKDMQRSYRRTCAYTLSYPLVFFL